MTEPLASFENPRYRGKRNPMNSVPGSEGTPGTRAYVTTAQIKVLSKLLGELGNGAQIQFKDPACFSFAGRLYNGGVPAAVTLNPGAGTDFRLTAKAAGTNGNLISYTAVKDGNNSSLVVAVSGNAITVHLATDGSNVITSTAATVVAAINASEAAAALVEARLTEASSGVTALVSETFLTGGTSDTNVTTFLPASGADGTTNTTLTSLRSTINGDATASARFDIEILGGVLASAKIAYGSVLTLAGGTDPTGRYAQLQDDREIKADVEGVDGTSHSKTTNSGMETDLGRKGQSKIIANVTTQDRAITADGVNRIAQTYRPRSPYL
jgi:hypothetical protein